MSTEAAVEEFARLVNESPVPVWIKDLDGRYVHANAPHAQQLGISPEQVAGISDEDLPPERAIRVADGATPDSRSAQSHCLIEASESRPAMAAWQFPLQSSDGQLLAVCWVAAPLHDAPVARREHAKLLGLAGERGLTSVEAHNGTSNGAVAPDRSRQTERIGTSVDDARARLDELGRLLADASGRLSELDRLFDQASRPFEELETLLGNVRDTEATAIEASARAEALGRELATRTEEVESLREALTRDQAALASESKQRQEWESRAADALTQIEEMQRRLQDEQQQLQDEQDKAVQLEADLANAEVRVTTSAQEANAAKLRAEAAKHDAEAARLEAQAARQDVDAARLEAEALQQQADSAQAEAQRFREAAEAAFEQMQAVRAEWAPSAATPSWFPDNLQPEPVEGSPVEGEASSAERPDELEAGDDDSAQAPEAVAESAPETESPVEAPVSEVKHSDEPTMEAESPAVDATEAEAEVEDPAEEEDESEGAPEAAQPTVEALADPVGQDDGADDTAENSASTAPADPAALAEEPVVSVEEPAASAPEPTVSEEEPAVAANAPSVPLEEPAVAAEAPDEPAEEAALSAEAPSEPTDGPEVSADAPGEPAEEPALSAEAPSEPTDGPEVSADTPGEPAEEPALSAEAPSEPTDGPEVSADTPGEPTDEPEDEPTSVQVGTISPLGWSAAAKLALTASLADCASASRLLETAVRVIGTRGGWDAAIAWTHDGRTLSWTPATFWTAAPDAMDRFEVLLKHLRAENGTAIAQAGFEGKINWICHPVPQNDRSLTTMTAEGMSSFAVIPLKREPEITAVLQLCSRHEGRPGAELRMALEAMAVEVASTYDALGGPDSPKGWGRWRRR
jgi:PAS domain-containing protein